MQASAKRRPGIIVSACLTGVRCRYDGGHRLDQKVLRRSMEEELVPLCPEQMGGLSIPRHPSEIIGGDGDDVLDGRARVVDTEGMDVTGQFLKGADEFLSTAKRSNIKKAIMKEKSPSCGVHRIYRNGILVSGKGVLTALLMREGIGIMSNEEI
jgi:uncharacterized protein YbbK (DUF523 family)